MKIPRAETKQARMIEVLERHEGDIDVPRPFRVYVCSWSSPHPDLTNCFYVMNRKARSNRGGWICYFFSDPKIRMTDGKTPYHAIFYHPARHD